MTLDIRKITLLLRESLQKHIIKKAEGSFQKTPLPKIKSSAAQFIKKKIGVCWSLMAEREGFEPSMGYKTHTPLAGERLQPLGHLSRIY